MNRQFEAAWRLHTFLTARHIPYAVIGGIAVQRWGQPRFTRVIHKALAGRAQDLLDIEGLVARQGASLDIGYVRRWLTELSRLADDPDMARRFERAWAAYRPRG